MKELTIIRHAKSSWDNPSISDFDRPLNSRGKQNATMMGKVLHEEGIVFDQIISSSANRAITTANTIACSIGYPKETIKKELNFYGADTYTIFTKLKRLNPSIVHVAICRHNPTFHSLIEKICFTSIVKFPTCAIASITLEIDVWKELSTGSGKLKVLRRPRDYIYQ